jgi:ATP-dependent exoDNAse (exonuclease V) beta subunit
LGLKAAASAFARHPRLLAQVEAYVMAVFSCAAAAVLAYEGYKRAWGLVDFVDQERLALELLAKPELDQQLRERLQTVFVDEFQDTNPLQLAVFVAVSRLAGSSVWIGDPKQSIYRFRQTDPDLITYVAQDIRKATGGADLPPLDRNWRSRRGLVDFFNDAFAPTFQAHGLPPEATRIPHVERADLPGQQTPLNIWRAVNGGGSTHVSSVVAGVLDALAKADEWKVADGDEARPLAPGDVAILCRSNPACLSIADALAGSGLKVAIKRDGLFGTLECRLALAALRWCADRRDGVALAEMAHLFGNGEGQPAWFEASLEEDGLARIEAMVPIAKSLRDVAEGGRHKTPLEFLDAVLGAGGVSQAILRWGAIDDRLLNLEALRGVVASYEEERRRGRAPATVSDLCAWLARQEAKRPASRAKDAVTVMTYHGAKGLEWPLVILTDLDSEPKGDAFGVQVASEVPTNAIDWRDPLAGRWIRFWPWPLGKQAKNVSFDTTAANSREGAEAARAERAERARLLYVGATRARDYLVLAARKAVTKKEQRIETEWLDELVADAGGQVMAVPTAEVSSVRVNNVDHPVRVAEFQASADGVASAPSVAFGGPVNPPTSHLPLRLRPSDAGRDDEAEIVDEVDLGWRLPFSGSSDMASVGEAIHRFLAADDPSRDDSWRVALASRLLDAWGFTCLDPRHVVEMGTRFRGFVDKHWPGAVLRREAPINYRIGDRTMSGRLDVVVETPDAIIVVDHKSFPGPRPQWLEQAKKHGGQLRLYREAIRASMPVPKPVKLALHLPIAGEVLMVE